MKHMIHHTAQVAGVMVGLLTGVLVSLKICAWLETGLWCVATLEMLCGFTWPTTGWIGVDRIIEALWESSAVYGGLFVTLGAWLVWAWSEPSYAPGTPFPGHIMEPSGMRTAKDRGATSRPACNLSPRSRGRIYIVIG
jgi:hypothetical protein